jgi:hypothetical protein
MTAAVIQLRDYEWARPVDDVARGPAVIVILPVVRVERLVEDVVAAGRALKRRSLLGDV